MLSEVSGAGDAYDKALAESFVDSFKTELIADRVWRSRAQLELATVECIGWFNNARLHSALGYLPPGEYEADWQADQTRVQPLPAQAATAEISAPTLASGLSEM